MRYSQPFGTPAPPLGQYPRYINGDPITGTEGSIPPGTAFDEDQIEIISVIENVRSLGLIGAPGPPSHSDLTQLWQAINAFFNKQYITTAITKTVHGAGADFPDLLAAFSWLSNYIITPTGYVTFMVSAGKWSYSQSIELSHANLDRVAIQGGALLGGSPTGSNMSVTGYHSSVDGTNQVIYLRSVYATELAFINGTTGFLVLRGGCVIRYLLITGSQNVGTPPGFPMRPNFGYGSGIECYDRLVLDGVAVWGFGWSGAYLAGGGTLMSVSSLSCTFAFNVMHGLEQTGAFIRLAGESIMTSNGYHGLSMSGGVATFGPTAGKAYIRGSGHDGAIIEGGAVANMGAGSTIATNNGDGVLVVAAEFIGQYNTYANNAQWGVYAQGPSAAFIVAGSAFSGNGSGSYAGESNATIA